jgi:biopolymer transport protein ExbD
MRFHSQQTQSKPFHNMSAMIDIVFLLLVFFMLTLHIAVPEGSHEVTAQEHGCDFGEVEIPLIHVRIEASGDGSLATVTLNNRLLGRGEAGLTALGREIQFLCEVLGPENSGEAAIVIEADFELNYEFSIRAMGLCSSKRDSDGRLISLGPQVRLTSARNPAMSNDD